MYVPDDVSDLTELDEKGEVNPISWILGISSKVFTSQQEQALSKFEGDCSLEGFVTEKDKAVFWTGYSFDPLANNYQKAREYAERKGKFTIEMTEGGTRLMESALYDSGMEKSKADYIWLKASEKFASQASGHVVAFINDPRSTNGFPAYNGLEYELLLNSSVVYLSERIYWEYDPIFTTSITKDLHHLTSIISRTDQLDFIASDLSAISSTFLSLGDGYDFETLPERFSAKSTVLFATIQHSVSLAEILIQSFENNLFAQKLLELCYCWKSLYAVLSELSRRSSTDEKRMKAIAIYRTDVRMRFARVVGLEVVPAWENCFNDLWESVEFGGYFIFVLSSLRIGSEKQRNQWSQECTYFRRNIPNDERKSLPNYPFKMTAGDNSANNAQTNSSSSENGSLTVGQRDSLISSFILRVNNILMLEQDFHLLVNFYTLSTWLQTIDFAIKGLSPMDEEFRSKPKLREALQNLNLKQLFAKALQTAEGMILHSRKEENEYQLMKQYWDKFLNSLPSHSPLHFISSTVLASYEAIITVMEDGYDREETAQNVLRVHKQLLECDRNSHILESNTFIPFSKNALMLLIKEHIQYWEHRIIYIEALLYYFQFDQVAAIDLLEKEEQLHRLVRKWSDCYTIMNTSTNSPFPHQEIHHTIEPSISLRHQNTLVKMKFRAQFETCFHNLAMVKHLYEQMTRYCMNTSSPTSPTSWQQVEEIMEKLSSWISTCKDSLLFWKDEDNNLIEDNSERTNQNTERKNFYFQYFEHFERFQVIIRHRSELSTYLEFLQLLIKAFQSSHQFMLQRQRVESIFRSPSYLEQLIRVFKGYLAPMPTIQDLFQQNFERANTAKVAFTNARQKAEELLNPLFMTTFQELLNFQQIKVYLQQYQVMYELFTRLAEAQHISLQYAQTFDFESGDILQLEQELKIKQENALEAWKRCLEFVTTAEETIQSLSLSLANMVHTIPISTITTCTIHTNISETNEWWENLRFQISEQKEHVILMYRYLFGYFEAQKASVYADQIEKKARHLEPSWFSFHSTWGNSAEIFRNTEHAYRIAQQKWEIVCQSPFPEWREKVDEQLQCLKSTLLISVGHHDEDSLKSESKNTPLASLRRINPHAIIVWNQQIGVLPELSIIQREQARIQQKQEEWNQKANKAEFWKKSLILSQTEREANKLGIAAIKLQPNRSTKTPETVWLARSDACKVVKQHWETILQQYQELQSMEYYSKLKDSEITMIQSQLLQAEVEKSKFDRFSRHADLLANGETVKTQMKILQSRFLDILAAKPYWTWYTTNAWNMTFTIAAEVEREMTRAIAGLQNLVLYHHYYQQLSSNEKQTWNQLEGEMKQLLGKIVEERRVAETHL